MTDRLLTTNETDVENMIGVSRTGRSRESRNKGEFPAPVLSERATQSPVQALRRTGSGYPAARRAEFRKKAIALPYPKPGIALRTASRVRLRRIAQFRIIDAAGLAGGIFRECPVEVVIPPPGDRDSGFNEESAVEFGFYRIRNRPHKPESPGIPHDTRAV